MKQLLVITGATSGIGLECIKQFMEIDGLYILAIGRKTDFIKIDNERLIKCNCDVTDFAKLKSSIELYNSNYKIVGLINSAGVCSVGDVLSDNHDNNAQMIDVNIQGLTNCIEIVLLIMRHNRFGTIINLSSLADRYPRPNIPIYAATKAYVKSLSDSLRVSNAKYNIRIINIAPAFIETPMVTNILGITDNVIKVDVFVNAIKQIYLQPQNICIRDMVIAPTLYEG